MKGTGRVYARALILSLCVASVGAAPLTTRATSADDDSKVASKYVVSAKAGGINFIAGQAEFRRTGAAGWQTLAAKDELRRGDEARTGADGRIEMLLTPGSYLRIGGDTAFVFTDSSLNRLALKMSRGTAIIEALDAGDGEPLITIETPHTKIAVVRGGIYRVNVGGGETAVFVNKGRALVGGSSTALVKGSRKTIIAGEAGATPVAIKFDKKRERDELDLWSKERAEELAKANRKLSHRSLSTSLASFSLFDDPFRYGVRRGGIWVFDARRGGYTYVPYGFGSLSPYGCGYNTAFGFNGGYGGAPLRPVVGSVGIYTSPGGVASTPTPGNPGGIGTPRSDSTPRMPMPPQERTDTITPRERPTMGSPRGRVREPVGPLDNE